MDLFYGTLVIILGIFKLCEVSKAKTVDSGRQTSVTIPLKMAAAFTDCT
jgi:hypothetical protein